MPIHPIIERVLPTLAFNKEYVNRKVDPVLKELGIKVNIKTSIHVIERMHKFGLVDYSGEGNNGLSVYGCISTEGDRIKRAGGWFEYLNQVGEEIKQAEKLKEYEMRNARFAFLQNKWFLIPTIGAILAVVMSNFTLVQDWYQQLTNFIKGLLTNL